MIHGVAVVPTTPLLVDSHAGARHPDIDRLAVAASEALDGLDGADVVVLLACGDALSVSGRPSTDLSGYGMDLDPHPLTTPSPDVVQALLGGVLGAASDGGGDLRVMARLVPPGTTAVGVSVPSDVTVADARAVARLLADLAADRSVAVVGAGDLGAGHGRKPPRPTAAEASTAFDEAVVAALDGRPADLLAIDLDLAARAHSRGAGALRVVGALAADLDLVTAVRASGAPLGVGYVVAAST